MNRPHEAKSRPFGGMRRAWGHVSRHCVYCGKVGPRVVVASGYAHRRCIPKSPKRDERAEVAKLADELFSLVQGPQGYFHVSDGETFATKAEFFERIRGRLKHGKMACANMAHFLSRHGER